jgi:uncharacterized membrane protein YgdD (TMEM256/DUF423 family)
MDRLFVFLGSLAAGIGVGLGAWGAHGLHASKVSIAVYQTAVQYHLIHALGLVLAGCVSHWQPRSALVKSAGWLFFVGIILFSGSLYIRVLTGASRWGAVTPFGGAAFMLGWLMLAIGVLKRR